MIAVNGGTDTETGTAVTGPVEAVEETIVASTAIGTVAAGESEGAGVRTAAAAAVGRTTDGQTETEGGDGDQGRRLRQDEETGRGRRLPTGETGTEAPTGAVLLNRLLLAVC